MGEEKVIENSTPSTKKIKLSFDSENILSLTAPAPFTRELKTKGTKKKEGLIRVYSDGIFDCFHFGHARALMQVKQMFTNCYLIVGVCGDQITNEIKGETVMTETERFEAVRHCRYVDEVYEYAPWVITKEFLEENEIDYVAHDDIPYCTADSDDIYAPIKQMNKFIATQRTEGISTSDIICRVVKNYDKYIRRNLSRGFTRKDLNVSYVRAKRAQIASITDEIKQKVTSGRSRMEKIVERWEQNSQRLIQDFVEVFTQSKLMPNYLKSSRIFLNKIMSPTELESDDNSPDERSVETTTETSKVIHN